MDFDLVISKAQEIIVKAQNGKANASIITTLVSATDGTLSTGGVVFETSGTEFNTIVGDKRTELSSDNSSIITDIDGLADDIKAEV